MPNLMAIEGPSTRHEPHNAMLRSSHGGWRDSPAADALQRRFRAPGCAQCTASSLRAARGRPEQEPGARLRRCLLYTSDAADDLLCVDLGGRRIIKKKK